MPTHTSIATQASIEDIKNILSMKDPVGTDVLREKYLKQGEKTEADLFKRVSKGLVKNYKDEPQAGIWQGNYLNQFRDGHGVGAGRIMSATGTLIEATSINCFVLGVGDSIDGYDEDGIPGIYVTLREAAVTLRRGGGCGYNFSLIRPRGAYVKGTDSYASGPCSYIDVYDKSCATVESAGGRRGAQMGVLDISHPDIEEFITAKRTPGRWNYFNVSVLVSDAFMDAVKNDTDWQLTHKKPPATGIRTPVVTANGEKHYLYRVVNARVLWDTIMRSNYDFAEPGILFEDTINRDNNLRSIEKLKATNPCGEQPLPNNACCDLGPLNVSAFVHNKFGDKPVFSWNNFRLAIATHVRMLDDVLDVTFWPLESQKAESDSKRRIGVGLTGLGTAMMYMRIVYGSEEADRFSKEIFKVLAETAYTESVRLAVERGPFPLFNVSTYLEKGTFASRLPDHIKELIKTYGIRNSHLLSIAPTGTVSLAFFDNVSSGIEPAFSLLYTRKVRNRMDPSKSDVYTVIDKGLKEYLLWLINWDKEETAVKIYNDLLNGKKADLPEYFKTALEMTVDEHMSILKIAAPLIDTAISKTVNVPADYAYEDFKEIYNKAHEFGLKGISTYRPNNILGSVLDAIKPKEEAKPAEIKAEVVEISLADQVKWFLNDTIEKLPEKRLNAIRGKISYQSADGPEQIYVVVTYLSESLVNDGEVVTIKRPIEVFITTHDQGASPEWLNAQSISMSLLARSGLEMFYKNLENMRSVRSPRGAIRYGYGYKEDGSKYPLWHESTVAVVAYEVLNIMTDLGLVEPERHSLLSYAEIAKRAASKLIVDTLPEVEAEVTVAVEEELVFQNGKHCPECGAHAVIKASGCDRCTNCGVIGSCG